MIFVRPRPRRVEQERLSLLVAGAKVRVVDAPGNGVHALRRQTEQLDRAAADELAGHDYRIGVAGGAFVRPRPPEPLGPRKELGVVEMLQVVNRHDCRQVQRR